MLSKRLLLDNHFAELQVQEHRRQHHRGYQRWPPHINLCWPFLEDSAGAFKAAADRLAEITKSWQPLQVRSALLHSWCTHACTHMRERRERETETATSCD